MFGPDIHTIIEIFKNGYYLVMIYPIVLEKQIHIFSLGHFYIA